MHKVSIITRGVAALGCTLQLPVAEKFLSTENERKDQLAILLGGRVAKELAFGDVSSGASNDLERASEIARDMVTRLGMSAALGPLTYGRRQQSRYLGSDYVDERNYSEATAQEIDAAVKALVDDDDQPARSILERQCGVLDILAARLQEREVLTGEEVQALLEEHQRLLVTD